MGASPEDDLEIWRTGRDWEAMSDTLMRGELNGCCETELGLTCNGSAVEAERESFALVHCEYCATRMYSIRLLCKI